MAKEAKRAIRATFRRTVFERAKYHCECCGKPGYDRQDEDSKSAKLVPLDAHHITNRNEMPNGGYTKYNGISVCDDCHLLAEDAAPGFEPELLYEKIGSSYEEAVTSSTSL